MDFVNLPLFGAAALVFASVLGGLFSARLGLSFLLVFLVTGIVAGEDGLGGLKFDNYVLSFWVGNVALAVILLDGGLRTTLDTFRTGLRPAALLATVGVMVCAGITGASAVWLLDLDWPTALLLGAVVGSTDAAAVFSLLGRSGVVLNERVAATLEIESGVNDPMAVYLTLACIGVVLLPADQAIAWADMGVAFVRQLGWGALAGLVAGVGMAALLRRVASRDVGGGIAALLVLAGGLTVFAATGLLEGSGFLAVYLLGLVLANRAQAEVLPTLGAMDGYAWLSQAGMFLLLGLLVTPHTMLPDLGPALGVALVLIFVARPVAVALCLWPLHFPPREIGFIAWVGLRGAVPIVLALFPLLGGVPQAFTLFNAAFVIVLVSLLVQGTSIGWMARRLGVALPGADDEVQQRAVFQDFGLDPAVKMSQLCAFYGLPEPDEAHLTLGEWLAHALHRPPVVGDSVHLGPALLVVREMDGRRIRRVGLGLPE